MNRPLSIGAQRETRSRKGSIVVIAGVSFTLLIGLAAVSIDLGRARVAKSELQYVADASSHAAVVLLDGTADGVTAATTMVNTIASQALVYGVAPTVDSVETGYWDGDSSTWTSTSDPAQVKGLKITLSATLNYIGFSKVAFGTTALTPRATGGSAKGSFSGSDAQEPAGEVECYIPIAVPSCVIEQMMATNKTSETGTWQPSTSNNVAWADQTSNPSSSVLSAQFNSLSGGCSGGATMTSGGTVYLNNGMIAAVTSTVANFLNTAATDTWDTADWGAIPARMSGSALTASRYGHVIAGPMVVFEDESYCAGGGSGALNGTKTIKGFVFTAIYDVKSSGSDKNLKMYIPNPENFTGDQVTDYMGGDNGAVEGNSSGFNYNISYSTSDGGGITGIPLE
jgi:Flp pilus assembly protein TadG